MKDAVVSVVIFLWVFGSQCIFQTTSQTTQPEPKPPFYPPQTLGLAGIQVQSGPVVLVDKRTLFIPNLHYDNQNDHGDTHFWVGNGSEPTSAGLLVPDENGSETNLHPYQHQNIYVTLPANTTTDTIEYFGVWSRADQISLGHVRLMGFVGNIVPEATGHERTTMDGKEIIRLPKCCQQTAILNSSGECLDNNTIAFKPDFQLFEHNQTHINNESLNLDQYEFQPYTSSPSCPAGRFALDKKIDSYGILKNGSLILRAAVVTGILTQGDFCIDNIKDETDAININILICVPPVIINHAMFHAYIVLLVVSMLSFALAFCLYYFVLPCEHTHKKCFIGYSFCMCVTFLSLVIIQVAHVESAGCQVLGFIFQFAMISSFTWLAILCVDIMLLVIHNDDANDRSRDHYFYYYLGASVAVPVLFLIISLSRNLIPDVPDSFFKPQYERNTCYFESENQRKIIFYFPIGIAVVVSAVCLGYTKFKIVQGDRTLSNNYFWVTNGQSYKFMLRQCFITLTIMTVCWILEIASNLIDDTSGFYNSLIVIEALQGVFIVLVFTMHHYGLRYWNQMHNCPSKDVELNHLNEQ